MSYEKTSVGHAVRNYFVTALNTVNNSLFLHTIKRFLNFLFILERLLVHERAQLVLLINSFDLGEDKLDRLKLAAVWHVPDRNDV